jgi:hypothetical protein
MMDVIMGALAQASVEFDPIFYDSGDDFLHALHPCAGQHAITKQIEPLFP